MKYAVILLAALVLAACNATTRGNSDIDYRADSFSTVNHCLHNTLMRCR